MNLEKKARIEEMSRFTPEEQDLLRSIIANSPITTEPFSFRIRQPNGSYLNVEGSEEFFNADVIRQLYVAYAEYVIQLHRENQTLRNLIEELEQQIGVNKQYTKSPVGPIRLSDL